MGATRITKRLFVAAVAIAGLAGGALAAQAAPFSSRAYEAGASQDLATTPAPPWPAVPSTCTIGGPCNVLLTAGAGLAPVKDAVAGDISVPFWGFGVSTTSTPSPVGLAGTPQSIIKVPLGTVIDITLSQSGVGGPIDLSFPSLSHVVEHSATSYTVTADKVGTMVFQPGGNDDAPRQIAMGLVGVLIVTPTSGAPAVDCTNCAYSTATPYQDEAVVAMTDLDNAFAQDPLHYDMSYFGQPRDAAQQPRRVYHMINGKSFPDTDVIDAQAGDSVLLRYVNAGVRDKNMGLLGLRQTLLGRNASPYTDSQSLVAPLVGPGETADVEVAIPADTRAGQKFSLMDQGRAMNHGSDEGFGGALTFIDVWAGVIPVVDSVSFGLTPNTLEASGHPYDATHTLTGYQFLVTDSATPPLAADWVAAPTPFSPALAPGDIGSFTADLTATPPTNGQWIWVRMQQDGGAFSAPVSVQVTIDPSVVWDAWDTATQMATATATAVAPATVVSYETAFTPDTTEPASGTSASFTGNPITLDGSAHHGEYAWVRVVDSLGSSSQWVSMLLPYDKPTVTISGYDGTNVTATAAADPLLTITGCDVAVTTGAAPVAADWTACAGPDFVNISEPVTAAQGDTIWVRVTDSNTTVSDPATFVVL